MTSSGRSLPGQHPLPRLRILERLGEQVVEQQHLDSAFAHQVDEGVVLLPRAPHPDHVVEEEVVAVARRQALVGDIGPVHEHGAERPDLRVRAEGVGGGRDSHVSLLSALAKPTRFLGLNALATAAREHHPLG